MSEELSDELRRFLLTIPSIPYLEAMLLLRGGAGPWSGEMVAKRLYLPVEQVLPLLQELRASGICRSAADVPEHYVYAPPQGLAALIDRLAGVYARDLIGITNLIHAQSHSHQRIQQFADAFKLRKGQ